MKRRSFIKKSAAAGLCAGAVIPILGRYSARAYGRTALLARLAAAAGDRVLVVLQLDGGNDGLNTVVPHTAPLYHQFRGALAINDSLPLNSTLGLNPGMSGIKSLYDSGDVAVVQNVGYNNPNRSHFRSTDIWFTASNNSNPPDADTYLYDGWLGRYLEQRFPEYPDKAPAHPMALQIGTTTALMLQGPVYPMGMAVNDPEQFYRIISGTDISGAGQPDLSTPAGLELDYIQRIAAEAISYATPVRDAYNKFPNAVTYPAGTVSTQLKLVARLIAGGLETPLYIITQRGYDTHSDQKPRHLKLLTDMSDGIAAFFQDLAALGAADRTALMTVSEFGRRAQANSMGSGKEGTDHGTAAPMFFIGPKVRGGVIGRDPDLANLVKGDITHEFDFKSAYASVLRQWFGAGAGDASLVLKGEWPALSIFEEQATGSGKAPALGFNLEQNHPNPVSLASGAVTRFRFTVPGGRASLRVYDVLGREAAVVLDAHLAPGTHEAVFDAGRLASGTYLYRLESRGSVETRMMSVKR